MREVRAGGWSGGIKISGPLKGGDGAMIKNRNRIFHICISFDIEVGKTYRPVKKANPRVNKFRRGSGKRWRLQC